MRIIIHGVGAIGGVVGAALVEAGQEVLGIARGRMLEAIRARGLTMISPKGRVTVDLPCVATPSEITFRPDDVVLLCVKGQDTESALADLRAAGMTDQPLFCLQNGTANERTALRYFPNVHGVTVMMPATYLEPGEVITHGAPCYGLFEIDRYPQGSDADDAALKEALDKANIATFVSEAVMEAKYGKLLMNLGNIVDAMLPLDADKPRFTDRLKDEAPQAVAALFQKHPQLAGVLDATNPEKRASKIYLSEHEDEVVSVVDDYGKKASPADYIESFEAYVRANMNAVPAMIAATQRPRELTRKELKELATLLDEQGFSEAGLRRAYGMARNADIAAHIIGFVRQAAIGDPLVPYETRVENGLQQILASRSWTQKQRQWLNRIGRALKAQPVGDPELLAEPLFAQFGGFETIDREFDSTLETVLKDLNTAIWDSSNAA